MTPALLFAKNDFGSLPPHIVKRLEAVIANPTQETWDDAYTILITPNTTLWQAVINYDNGFCRRKKLDAPWDEIPSARTIKKAIATVCIPYSDN